MFTDSICFERRSAFLGSFLDRIEILPEESAIILRDEDKVFETARMKLKDKEPFYVKFQRWLIGINWNAFNEVDKKSIMEEIDNLKKRINDL